MYFSFAHGRELRLKVTCGGSTFLSLLYPLLLRLFLLLLHTLPMGLHHHL
jgi:hypothetical protein